MEDVMLVTGLCWTLCCGPEIVWGSDLGFEGLIESEIFFLIMDAASESRLMDDKDPSIVLC